MQEFDPIIAAVEAMDIHKMWTNSTYMCSVTYGIVSNSYYASVHANDRSGARRKRGIYRHIDKTGKVWYVGKAVESKSSIGKRQSAHFGNFRGSSSSESSGATYRAMMKAFGIDTLVLDVEYIDMSHLPQYIVDMFEKKTLETFKPHCNKQSV
jgi:hypothetical protein